MFFVFSILPVLAGKWRHKMDSNIERTSVTSRYHGSKISGSQHFLTGTAICVVERWKKSMGTVLFLSAIMHRKVIGVIFFFRFFCHILRTTF